MMIMMVGGSASLDVEVLHMGDHADAGPAFGFHLVEVLETGKVSRSVRSSSLRRLLADGVGSAHVVHAGHLQRFSALLGMREESQHGEQSNNNHTSHCRFIIINPANNNSL
jgi:hypothetical protein